MLPRADLNTNRPPAALEASTSTVSSTDARLEIFKRLSQIAIGREVQASVQSALDDGTYLVKVADSAARMALPVGTRVGENLSMVFLAKEPRPTFLLTQQQGSAPALLSATARFISQLVQDADQDGLSPALLAKTPLLPLSSAMEPERMAMALRNAVVASGLFYEAHLHEWINGNRPAGELAREPQAQFANARSSATQQDAGAIPERDLSVLAGNMRELGDGVQKLLKLMRNGQLQAADPLLTDADVIAQTQGAIPNVEPEAARLINLQLGILENQQIRWQGELWPGQKMEWDIAEDKSGDGAQQAPEQAAWTSTVRFELPHLGKISATVRLSGEHVQVHVDTADDASATSLREHGPRLTDALGAAGATLDSLLVKQNEASG
jgi:hypothetical protein